MIEANNVLVIAAHPDDEALGCGGTIARLSSTGSEVHVLFVADGVSSRETGESKALQDRREMAERAVLTLGAHPPSFLDFPDNRLDSVALLDVIQAIEAYAATVRADLVFTHSPGDLNVDHRLCSQAVLTAFRPAPGQSVRTVLAFEVPSSTEWSFGSMAPSFAGNLFLDISDYLAVKAAALRCYAEEMRNFPHSRSIEAVEALARWRGATVGVEAAEAFTVLRSVT